jgi:hypothetical protein
VAAHPSHFGSVKTARVVSPALNGGGWDEAQETAREALLEPTGVSTADFAVELAIWETVLAEYSDFDDDLSEESGWIDWALPRLFKDARALLGCPGTVA